jgi:hypothetical protein
VGGRVLAWPAQGVGFDPSTAIKKKNAYINRKPHKKIVGPNSSSLWTACL